MALLVWFTMGLAIWHFSIWVPDRFQGGIVGALLGGVAGSMLVGAIVQQIRGLNTDTADITTVVVSIPGAVAGLVAVWLIGNSRSKST